MVGFSVHFTMIIRLDWRSYTMPSALQELFEFHDGGASWAVQESAACHLHFIAAGDSHLCAGKYGVSGCPIQKRNDCVQCNRSGKTKTQAICQFSGWQFIFTFIGRHSAIKYWPTVHGSFHWWLRFQPLVVYACTLWHRRECALLARAMGTCHRCFPTSALRVSRQCRRLCFSWVSLVFRCYLNAIQPDFFWHSSFSFQCILSLFMLVISDVHVLITYSMIVESFFIMLSVSSVLYFRYKEPDMPRPIKVRPNTMRKRFSYFDWVNCMLPYLQLPLIIPITFFLISAFLMVVPFYVAPYEVGMGILITVAGIPVYWFGVLWKDKPKFVQKSIGK